MIGNIGVELEWNLLFIRLFHFFIIYQYCWVTDCHFHLSQKLLSCVIIVVMNRQSVLIGASWMLIMNDRFIFTSTTKTWFIILGYTCNFILCKSKWCNCFWSSESCTIKLMRTPDKLFTDYFAGNARPGGQWRTQGTDYHTNCQRRTKSLAELQKECLDIWWTGQIFSYYISFSVCYF